jgi:hypothetical protein
VLDEIAAERGEGVLHAWRDHPDRTYG